jgi:3',5'-cyclic-AMP phosphodiesterase
MDRRQFLASAAAAGATLIGSNGTAQPAGKTAARPAAQDFDFLFFTDTHLQPELNAAKGCAMAFRSMRKFPHADFAIQGGDHVFDTLLVPRQRSLSLWQLYDQTQQELSLKVYHTIGNHDLFGLRPASGVDPSDPAYGKKFYADHIGKTYYSFDHKGVHFVVLDSVQITPDRDYEGRIDAEQLQWLRADLGALPAGTPVIVVTHIPLVTAVDAYLPRDLSPKPHFQMAVVNSAEVLPVFEGHNVLAVLQGHTHIQERVDWHGVPYITGGAVCGNWWKGTRLGTREGYMEVRVRDGRVQTGYVTYGFQTVDPHNT